VIFVLFVVISALGYIDRKKKRPEVVLPSVSFVVPCYNKINSVEQTLKSIYDTCGPDVRVFVIDDGSTDGSREKLVALKKRYGFALILNSLNLGKAKTLNTYAHFIETDIVIFVDADVLINCQALNDAISRLQPVDVGAVSCPYRSENAGFIPTMQTIEYNMISFIQGAYNIFSAIALWGGFIVIKRRAFNEAGGFTLNAITEDIDLAFKLNERGWRVEQSFLPVRTYVPDTVKQWFSQKIRWSSGSLQCFIKYYKVWLNNPLQVLFVFSFCILLTLSTLKIGENITLWDDTIIYLFRMIRSEGMWLGVQTTGSEFGITILKDLICRLSFTLFTLPFVLPLVSTLRRIHFLLLVIPFSVFYIPVLSAISIISLIYFLHQMKSLRNAARSW
jgi:cellulose synthase/poly-beta-1,6-N-acetylglucosamine synthase-like glycosyltransferase